MQKTLQTKTTAEFSDEFSNSIWTFYETSLSNRTRTEYLNVIRNFIKTTQTDPLKLTQKSAETYAGYLTQRVSAGKLSYSTALMRISVMRSLCEYIRFRREQQGISYYNYFHEIVMPDVDKTLSESKLPSDDEINALLELAQEAGDERAFLIFSLAVKCGLTSSEISMLDIDYIVLDIQERFCIQFPEKKKTRRIIRLPQDISSLLNAYIDNNGISEGTVFLNQRNTRLKVRDAERILNKYIEQGIERNIISRHFTFQDMRHTAFRYMLSGGASEEEVACYGGITTKWISRYRRVVHDYDALDTADYSVIKITPKR